MWDTEGPYTKGLGAMNPCDNLHLQSCSIPDRTNTFSPTSLPMCPEGFLSQTLHIKGVTGYFTFRLKRPQPEVDDLSSSKPSVKNNWSSTVSSN
jgi:hypothetical protein